MPLNLLKQIISVAVDLSKANEEVKLWYYIKEDLFQSSYPPAD